MIYGTMIGRTRIVLECCIPSIHYCDVCKVLEGCGKNSQSLTRGLFLAGNSLSLHVATDLARS